MDWQPILFLTFEEKKKSKSRGGSRQEGKAKRKLTNDLAVMTLFMVNAKQ